MRWASIQVGSSVFQEKIETKNLAMVTITYFLIHIFYFVKCNLENVAAIETYTTKKQILYDGV